MSPKKMIGLSFAAAAAKLYEVFKKPAGRVLIDAPGFCAALRRCKPTVSQNDGDVMPSGAILMPETGAGAPRWEARIMTNLLGSIRLAAYAFPLIAALVAVPFFDRQVRACCFNWVRTVFGGLFLFYVLCVLSLVFFPLPDAAQAARLSGHEIQLVPFQFVADFLRETPLVLSDARTYLPALFDRTVLQVVCNILMLLPFGMYLRYVCGLDLGKVALASLAFSAFIELGQLTGLFFVFRGSYRLCDVDDLMLNTLGGLLGGELVHALEAYLPPLDAFDRFPGSSALAMQRLG